MFGIGMPELFVILAVALIVIGPKKLPDLAKSMGQAIREFRKATTEIKNSLDVNSDLRNVKKAFEDIQTIKDSMIETNDTELLQKSPPDNVSGKSDTNPINKELNTVSTNSISQPEPPDLTISQKPTKGV